MDMNDYLNLTDRNTFIRVTVEINENRELEIWVHSGNRLLLTSTNNSKSLNIHRIFCAMQLLADGFLTTSVIHKRSNVIWELLFYFDIDSNLNMIEVG